VWLKINLPQAMSVEERLTMGSVAVAGSCGMRIHVPFPWYNIRLLVLLWLPGVPYLIKAVHEESGKKSVSRCELADRQSGKQMNDMHLTGKKE